MNYVSEKYDLKDFTYFVGCEFVKQKAPQIHEYEDVCVYPDGTISSTLNADATNMFTETVVYLGHFHTAHFGNVLIDYMSRLWWIPKVPTQWIYTASYDIKRYGYITHLLELAGIPLDKVVWVTKPVRYGKVIVPDEIFKHGDYILPQFRNVYARMYTKMDMPHYPIYEKIYLTRTRIRHQKEIGEWRFEEFFGTNGFTPISLETMPIEEQAWIVRHAKVIASIEGTHAHSVVWREGAAGAQIILRKQREVIPRQIMLNQLYGIETTNIDVFEEPFRGFPISHDRGPFLLKWTLEIEQYAKDNHMIIPEKCRKGYWLDVGTYTLKCLLYRIKHTVKRYYNSARCFIIGYKKI